MKQKTSICIFAISICLMVSCFTVNFVHADIPLYNADLPVSITGYGNSLNNVSLAEEFPIIGNSIKAENFSSIDTNYYENEEISGQSYDMIANYSKAYNLEPAEIADSIIFVFESYDYLLLSMEYFGFIGNDGNYQNINGFQRLRLTGTPNSVSLGSYELIDSSPVTSFTRIGSTFYSLNFSYMYPFSDPINSEDYSGSNYALKVIYSGYEYLSYHDEGFNYPMENGLRVHCYDIFGTYLCSQPAGIFSFSKYHLSTFNFTENIGASQNFTFQFDGYGYQRPNTSIYGALSGFCSFRIYEYGTLTSVGSNNGVSWKTDSTNTLVRIWNEYMENTVTLSISSNRSVSIMFEMFGIRNHPVFRYISYRNMSLHAYPIDFESYLNESDSLCPYGFINSFNIDNSAFYLSQTEDSYSILLNTTIYNVDSSISNYFRVNCDLEYEDSVILTSIDEIVTFMGVKYCKSSKTLTQPSNWTCYYEKSNSSSPDIFASISYPKSTSLQEITLNGYVRYYTQWSPSKSLSVTHPNDITMNITDFEAITWVVSFDSDIKTCNYIVYRNGTKINEGLAFDGMEIVVSLYALVNSSFIFKIEVSNEFSEYVEDYVNVTIVKEESTETPTTPTTPSTPSASLSISPILIIGFLVVVYYVSRSKKEPLRNRIISGVQNKLDSYKK